MFAMRPVWHRKRGVSQARAGSSRRVGAMCRRQRCRGHAARAVPTPRATGALGDAPRGLGARFYRALSKLAVGSSPPSSAASIKTIFRKKFWRVILVLIVTDSPIRDPDAVLKCQELLSPMAVLFRVLLLVSAAWCVVAGAPVEPDGASDPSESKHSPEEVGRPHHRTRANALHTLSSLHSRCSSSCTGRGRRQSSWRACVLDPRTRSPRTRPRPMLRQPNISLRSLALAIPLLCR